jgi:hypothetical protein
MDFGNGVAGFLESLADDEDMQDLFSREPVAVMEKFGLSESDQVLILEGAIGDIRDKITNELGKGSQVICFIIKAPPNPNPPPKPGGDTGPH